MAAPILPPVADMDAYRPLRADPAAWLPAVRVICARHGLDPEGAYCERTGTNVVFHVAQGPWIKLFPPLWVEDYVRERTGLTAAQDLAGVAVPELLHAGDLEGWPYLVLSHLEGHPVGTVWRDLPGDARRDVARQLGELLARLHEADPAACDAVREDDWPAYARGLWADAVERQVGHGLAPEMARPLARLLEAWGPPTAPPREVLLHADVTDEHVMLQEVGGRWRITGLIDFGDAMVGDREYELAAPLVFLTQGRPAVQRALLEGFGYAPADLTGALGRRLVRWCLVHRYGRVASYAAFAPEPTPRTLAALVASLWCPVGADPAPTGDL